MDLVKKIKNYTYNERHCLGEGSFGKVYEGRSDEGLQVAIKKVEQRMISKDAYLRTSLESQISIMKKLNHQNIVKLHDVVLTSNSIYLIMQFCAGGDLKRYCRNRKLSEDEATMIIKQICKGFQEIVKKGIIHRDLKPANILVHEGIFKICDFGFAKFFTDTSRMARTCVGTPIYMSPQVLNQKSYTNKTDVWSLGALYYELMFGKLPYNGGTEEELYRNIIRGQLQIPNCSKMTATLLKGMLEVDEGKRFDWNNLFDLFQLGRINENDFKKEEIVRNVLNRQKSLNEQRQNDSREKAINVVGQVRENNYMRDEYSPGKSHQQNWRENGLDVKKSSGPQRKPKNPLAFQNMGHQNNSPIAVNIPSQPPVQNPKPAVKSQNDQTPRFFYFILIELIVNPLTCQSYPNLVAALHEKTTELYTQRIQKEDRPVYKKVLASELEELRAIQSEIPKTNNNDEYQKLAENVLRECRQSREDGASLVWVERLLNKNYVYK